MNQFVLQQGSSGELRLFPHILELGIVKNSSIRLNAFPKSSSKGIKIFSVLEGKYEWSIGNGQYTLYPDDLALILPGQEFGSSNAVLEIGSFSWMHLNIQKNGNDEMMMGTWSSLSESENLAISKILLLNNSPVLSKFNDGRKILKSIQNEL